MNEFTNPATLHKASELQACLNQVALGVGAQVLLETQIEAHPDDRVSAGTLAAVGSFVDSEVTRIETLTAGKKPPDPHASVEERAAILARGPAGPSPCFLVLNQVLVLLGVLSWMMFTDLRVLLLARTLIWIKRAGLRYVLNQNLLILLARALSLLQEGMEKQETRLFLLFKPRSLGWYHALLLLGYQRVEVYQHHLLLKLVLEFKISRLWLPVWFVAYG